MNKISTESSLSTRDLAEAMGINHRFIVAMIKKYSEDMESFGPIVTKKIRTSSLRAGRPAENYFLNESQIMFLIMLLPNTEHMIKAKQIFIKMKNEMSKEIVRLLGEEGIKKSKFGYIYIIKNETGLVKIGGSINPESRVRAVETQSGYKVVDHFISEKIENFREFEAMLLSFHKNDLVLGEWFNSDFNKVKDSVVEIINLSLL